MTAYQDVLDEEFEERCPICGNRGIICDDPNGPVYCEDGDSMWDYYRWHCPKCGTAILEEIVTDVGTYLDFETGDECDSDDVCICPRCGGDADIYDNSFDDENGRFAVHINTCYYECLECGMKYKVDECWDVSESTIYAVKDRNGRIHSNHKYVGRMGDWLGESVEKYI